MQRLTFLLTIVLLAFGLTAPAHAKVCMKNKITALSGWNLTKSGARVGAYKAWRRKVKRVHGRRYANWTRSIAKHTRCWTVERYSLRRQRCGVQASPCRR